ncbi:cryptochrome/photolyase family protein [Myxococcota bacterium]|nr:cryptochrome/photolyase family protein [Myxococcota bacterium]
MKVRGAVERLHLVLGDQLDVENNLIRSLDLKNDAVLMLEVAEESQHVRTHIQRTLFFLTAMRHAAQKLKHLGYRVEYVRLDDPENEGGFKNEVERALKRLAPRSLSAARPGSYRVLQQIEKGASAAGWTLEILEDPHFLLTPNEFAAWASGRKTLIMGHFYQWMRKKMGVLVDGKQPLGGQWSFDERNRGAFKSAPSAPPPWMARADPLAEGTLKTIQQKLPDLEGQLSQDRWPTTRPEALQQLDQFIQERLPDFGRWQDAMWVGENFLWHSHLAPALNIKLLNPREVIAAALHAYEAGRAPIEAVEGFLRQIIGWREFMRGVYWTQGENYRSLNGLQADRPLPDAYWGKPSSMQCLTECIQPVLRHGYSHHIQRLMITGTFSMMAGCDPGEVRDWYLGMFIDGVDWVTTPNVIGMSQWADQGIIGTKPYAASGRYVQRMSNYCRDCSYSPGEKVGPKACPMTTLYWSFLDRHRDRFASNTRMKMMLRNLDRLDIDELEQIRDQAGRLSSNPAL